MEDNEENRPDPEELDHDHGGVPARIIFDHYTSTITKAIPERMEAEFKAMDPEDVSPEWFHETIQEALTDLFVSIVRMARCDAHAEVIDLIDDIRPVIPDVVSAQFVSITSDDDPSHGSDCTCGGKWLQWFDIQGGSPVSEEAGRKAEHAARAALMARGVDLAHWTFNSPLDDALIEQVGTAGRVEVSAEDLAAFNDEIANIFSGGDSP